MRRRLGLYRRMGRGLLNHHHHTQNSNYYYMATSEENTPVNEKVPLLFNSQTWAGLSHIHHHTQLHIYLQRDIFCSVCFVLLRFAPSPFLPLLFCVTHTNITLPLFLLFYTRCYFFDMDVVRASLPLFVCLAFSYHRNPLDPSVRGGIGCCYECSNLVIDCMLKHFRFILSLLLFSFRADQGQSSFDCIKFSS